VTDHQQCFNPSGGRSGISCRAEAQIPFAKVLSYAIVASGSGADVTYKFKPGTLNGLFDETVQGWYAFETSQYLADQADLSLSSSFFTVFLEVPTRFITGLTSPFPASLVLSAIAARINQPETSISNVIV
jgi:hypothetical protein